MYTHARLHARGSPTWVAVGLSADALCGDFWRQPYSGRSPASPGRILSIPQPVSEMEVRQRASIYPNRLTGLPSWLWSVPALRLRVAESPPRVFLGAVLGVQGPDFHSCGFCPSARVRPSGSAAGLSSWCLGTQAHVSWEPRSDFPVQLSKHLLALQMDVRDGWTYGLKPQGVAPSSRS